MADNNTLFFDLGLNTEQLEKDIVKARKRIAEMQIKAELDIEIPDISVKAFEKKVKELQAQMDKMTNIHNKAGYGIGSPEQKQFEEASQKLNKRIELYKKNIERLNSIDVSGGSSVNMKISGDEKVLNVIERINAGLSDLNMRIGLEGDEEVLRRLKEIEAVKNGLAELSTVKIDLKTQENTFSKTEVDKQIADAVAAKVEELEKKYKALAEAKEKAAKAGKDKPKEEDLEKNLANLEKQLQRIQTFTEKMDVRMENIVGGDFSEKGYKRLQALYDEYEALAANKSLSAQQVKDFQAKITAETQVVNALISAQQKYNSAQDKAREKQRKDDEKAEKEHLKNLDKLSKATRRAQLAELDVIKSGDKGDEQRIAKYLNQVKRLNEEIRELNNLEAKFRHQQIVGNISQDQLHAILSKLIQYRQELERIANLDISEFTDDLFNDNTGQAFRGVIQELNMDLSDAVAKQRKFKQATDESGEALRNQKKPAEEFNETLNFGLGYASQLEEMIRDTFSLYGIKRFAEQVITIGGEFEKQKIALKSILGDAIQAEVIYSQIKNLAVKSPFEFKDLTSYAKQLSAFSIPYNELFDTTKRLADISAGLGVDMDRIILAYGQVRSAAVLRGQELRQFTEAGIPLVQELADRFTELEGEVVSTGEVFDRISKRMVSFEMVQDILFDMTEEGGKFFEMQEELANSLSGKWSNLKDAYDIMLSEIAEGNSGVLKGTVELITRMLNNWEKWGALLGGAATAFGIYKAVLFAVNVQQAIAIRNTNALTAAQLANNVVYTRGAIAMTKWVGNISKWWKAIGSLGHWGLAAAAIGGLGVAMYNLAKNSDTLTDSFNKSARDISGKLNDDISNFKRLVKTLGETKEGTTEHNVAIEEIKSKYGSMVGDIDNVSNAYDYLNSKIQTVTNSLREQAKKNYSQENRIAVENDYNTYLTEYIETTKKRLKSAGFKDEENVIKTAENIRLEVERLFNNNITGTILQGSLRSYINTIAPNASLTTFENMVTEAMLLASKMAYKQTKEKEIELMANALFSTPEEPDPLLGWRKSVDDYINSLKEKSQDLYNALRPQAPKNDEKPLKDWAQGVLKLYDEVLADVNLQKKTKKTNPELVDEDELKSDEIRLNAYSNLIKKFNLENYRDDKDKTKDDPVADMWKKRIELLEKAQTLYKKWVDVEGHEAALKRVQGDETFGSIFSDKNLADILTDPDKVWRYIQSQLGGTEKQKELSTELDLKISERSYENVKKDADRFIEQLKNSLERSAERWDIYNDLIKAGFDKNVASSVAGGISFTSYVDELKHQLATQLEGSGISIEDALLGKADLSKVKNASFIGYLVDEINKENKRLNSESAKNLAELVKNYRNYEQKITEIKRSLETDISTIRGSDLSDEDKERMIEERRRVAKEDISKADFEEFKRTSDWVKVFDDLDRVSNDTLDSMIANIEKFIEGGVESEEVLKQIIEALRKLREEDIERNPFESFSDSWSKLKKIRKQLKSETDEKKKKELKNQETAELKNLEDSALAVADKFNAVAKAADFLGQFLETLGAKSSVLESVIDVFGGMASGAQTGASLTSAFGIAGPWGAIAGAAVGMLSSVFAMHDKALQKEIEASEARVDILNHISDTIEKNLERSGGVYNFNIDDKTTDKLKEIVDLYDTARTDQGDIVLNMKAYRKGGHISDGTKAAAQEALESGSYYDAQYALLMAERDELNRQLSLEEDKKKKDTKVIEDYKQQIDELDDKILHFAEDMAKALWNIDFQDWAKQLSDAIVGAWESGEDAVKAYEEVVDKILKDIVADVVAQAIIFPIIKKYADAFYAQFIKDDGKITEDSLKILAGLKDEAGTAVDAVTVFLNALAEMGIIAKDAASATGDLASNIKGVTEDTANILASYLNAIRQDVSIQRAAIVRLVDELLPQVSILGQAQLQQLSMIQQNTKRNADSNDALLSEIRAVINGTKSFKVK